MCIHFHSVIALRNLQYIIRKRHKFLLVFKMIFFFLGASTILIITDYCIFFGELGFTGKFFFRPLPGIEPRTSVTHWCVTEVRFNVRTLKKLLSFFNVSKILFYVKSSILFYFYLFLFCNLKMVHHGSYLKIKHQILINLLYLSVIH